MDNKEHKGTELSNVQDTWHKYERDLKTATEQGSEVNGKPETATTRGSEEQASKVSGEDNLTSEDNNPFAGDRTLPYDDQHHGSD